MTRSNMNKIASQVVMLEYFCKVCDLSSVMIIRTVGDCCLQLRSTATKTRLKHGNFYAVLILRSLRLEHTDRQTDR